jgi:DNA-binding response OmpR family regulator
MSGPTSEVSYEIEPGGKAMTRKKILLVDDAETILMMERMILNKAGYELITAKDGQEAVTKATTEHPDLILMDVVMPKMNGFEACKQLRGHDTTKTIPIIMVTTRGEAENVESGFESGCDDYITKPINGLEVLSKVKSALGQ